MLDFGLRISDSLELKIRETENPQLENDEGQSELA